MKKGFTLIELLVVVLIIGILAAVAVPQYQTVVTKSRLSTLMPLVDGMVKSLDLYYLANGSYPTSADPDAVFDIDLPAGCTPNLGTVAGTCFNNTVLVDVMTENPVVWACHKRSEIAYLKWAAHSKSPGAVRCLASPDNETANQVCKSMGGALTAEAVPSFSVYCLRKDAANVYAL